METMSLKLYTLLRKELNLSEEQAIGLVHATEGIAEEESRKLTGHLATRENLKEHTHSLKEKIHAVEIRLYRSIFLTGLIQVLTVIGGVLAVAKFLHA